MDELRRRITTRGQDSQEVIEKRMANAESELSMAKAHPEIFGTHFLTNDDQQRFINEARDLINTKLYPGLNI